MRPRVPEKQQNMVAQKRTSGPPSSGDPGNIETQNRAILEQLPQALWIANAQGTIIYSNQCWNEFSGLTSAQTTDKGWVSILHPEDHPVALANWRKLLATGKAIQGEYRFLRARDGEYRWHLTQIFKLKETNEAVGIAVDIHAHKTYETAIKERDDQLNLAIEAGRFGTWDFFLDGHKFNSSYRARAMFGRPPDVELSYEEFAAMLHPEDRDLLRQTYIRAMEPSGLSEFEIHYRIIRPDGAVRWIAARGKGIFSGAGSLRKPVRVTGTVQDITERKLAEDALLESEEKFRTAFHANPEAMTISTLADGVYLDVNEAFLRVTGFAREDVVGRRSLDLGLWVELEDRSRMVQELKAHRQAELLDTSFRKKNGDIFFVHLSAELIEIGNVQCVLATSQDITESKRVAEELRRSEEQHRSLIERAPYGICRISAEGRFLLVNPALARMLGYETVPELLALDVATQVYEDPAERARLISSLAEDTARQPPIETRWKRRDGRTITVRLAGRPIFDGQGGLLHSEVFVELVSRH
jgi:PAS domain S-box-containing protein